jgi:hypothetical protein
MFITFFTIYMRDQLISKTVNHGRHGTTHDVPTGSLTITGKWVTFIWMMRT